MFEQQLVKMWDENEGVALDSGDPDTYCLAAVNRRVVQTIAIASHEGWSRWKTRSICKYTSKVLESMAKVELSTIRDQAVQELIYHAAEGRLWDLSQLPNSYSLRGTMFGTY